MKGLNLLNIFLLFLLSGNLYGQIVVFPDYEINNQGYASVEFEGNPGSKGYKKTITILNNGDAPLLLKKVEGGCHCVKTKICKKTLRSQQKAKLTIIWKPDGDTEFSSSISIFSNDNRYPEIWIQLLGHVEEKW